MRSFYEEQKRLLDQKFVNPGKFKGSISDMLKKASCTLDKFVPSKSGNPEI